MYKYHITVLTILSISILPTICQLHSSDEYSLQTYKQWNVIRYNLPWDFPSRFNIPENIVATGIAIDYDRIFIATPRLLSGVPSTLSTISRKTIGDSPILEAYPDWSFHEAGQNEYNCSDLGLVSVYRLRIDSCHRIWALDAGVSRSLEDFEVTCPPKILIFDSHTNQVVRRIDFPREVIRGESLFTNLVIDETTSSPENNCNDAFVYITDTVEPAIVVYDSENDLTWRLSHPSMYPDPNFAQSNILGEKFTLMDGIVGIAFDEKAQLVYYQPLATDRIFSVSTSALRVGPLKFNEELAVKLVGKKSSQGIGLAVSPFDGSIFFSPFSETAVAKWNPHTNQQRILAHDPEKLQFPADIMVPETDPDTAFILSSRFHKYFLKNLNVNDVNVRILTINTHSNNDQYGNLDNNHNNNDFHALDGFHHNFLRTTHSNSLFPSPKPITKSPISYSHSYFNSIRQPNINPFTSLNLGESTPQHNNQNQYDGNDNHGLLYNHFSKLQNNFNDFNGLRNVKSVSFNTSVVH